MHSDYQTASPRPYYIIVEGRLEPSWSERLADMKVSPMQQDDHEKSKTILRGTLQDQAQLSGVLNTLYNLHLPLLGLGILDEAPYTGRNHITGEEP